MDRPQTRERRADGEDGKRQHERLQNLSPVFIQCRSISKGPAHHLEVGQKESAHECDRVHVQHGSQQEQVISKSVLIAICGTNVGGERESVCM